MKLPPARTGGGEETRVRHQIGNTDSVPESRGRAARSAWNRRAEAEREIVTLPHVISILQADLAHLTDVGRRWAPEGAAKAQAIENTRAKLAAAHAVIRTAEGRQ